MSGVHEGAGVPAETAAGLGPVIRVAVVVAVGGLLFGYDTGVISGALGTIESEFALSSWASGAVVSSILVGAMLGALGAGRVADRYGRRPVLLAAATIFFLGAILAALAPSALILAAARVLLGIGIGIVSNVVPVYIAEVAPARHRGRLVALNQLMITLGILLAYVSNFGFADVASGWRWMFGVAALPALLFGIGLTSLPESPRWLALAGRVEQARTVLSRLRGGGDTSTELAEMARREEGGRVGWRALTDRSVRLVLVAGIGLQLLVQGAGVNTVIYYAPTIFEGAGLGASAALLATIGVGVVNFVMTPVGMLLVDRVGRTRLLASGATVMASSLAGLATTIAIGGGGPAAVLAVVCVLVFIAAFASTVGVVIFTIPSELYPLRIRGTAMSATMFVNWATNFVVALTFLSLFEALGGAGTFVLYAAVCAVLAVFALRVIPETKDKSLEQIEREHVIARS